MNVIIDKSWLTQINKRDIAVFAKSKLLILIDALGYELFSTDRSNDKRKRQINSLWQKLYFVRNSVRLTWALGYYINQEIEGCYPIYNLEDLFLPVQFEPHTDLLEGSAVYSDQEIEALLKHKDHYEISGVKFYKEASAGVHNYLPELRKLKPGHSRDDIISIYKKVINDKDFVLYVYNDIRPKNFPLTNKLDENWIIYRWVQSRLLYGIDYIRKYGADNFEINTPKFINTTIDMDYVILSVLADGIASVDDDLVFIFKLMYPKKAIYGFEKSKE